MVCDCDVVWNHLNQFEPFILGLGEILWNQVLEARELLSSVGPIRSNSAKCSDLQVEFDEFNCVTIYVYESYFERSGEYTWDLIVEGEPSLKKNNGLRLRFFAKFLYLG